MLSTLLRLHKMQRCCSLTHIWTILQLSSLNDYLNVNAGFFFGRVFGKLRFWLCRNLEFLSWVLSYLLELFSFFLDFFENNQFPLKNRLFLQYFNWKLGILTILQALQCIFPFVWVNICSYFSKLCRNLEFFAWVLSYFPEALSFLVLEFFSNGPKKKPALNTHWQWTWL